jgi:hypothetical protein
MQKLVARFLSFVVLVSSISPNLDVEELYKVPRLVAHYLEHTMEDTELDFVEFLAQHYHTDQRNNVEHQDLPFLCHSCSNLLFVFVEFKLPSPYACIETELKHRLLYINFLSIGGNTLFKFLFNLLTINCLHNFY